MDVEISFGGFAAAVLPPGITAQQAGNFRTLAKPLSLPRRQAAQLQHGSDLLVYIASGAIKLAAPGQGGTEQILGFQFEGDLIFISREDLQSFQIIAMRQSELLVFDAARLFVLAREHPQLSENLARLAIQALHQCRAGLMAMGRRGAMDRVASFLVAMRTIRQVASDGGHTLSLLMTRREIADCLGLTVETVSRQFSQLRQMKIIETPSRTIVRLLDPNWLANRAGADTS